MKDQKCDFCGDPVPEQPGRGRPRMYCKPAHRQKAYEQRKLQAEYDRGFNDGMDIVLEGVRDGVYGGSG